MPIAIQRKKRIDKLNMADNRRLDFAGRRISVSAAAIDRHKVRAREELPIRSFYVLVYARASAGLRKFQVTAAVETKSGR